MPEVQQSQQSGEMTERFLGFVMMQAQQISLFLGRMPHPQTGETATNLEAAKIFIDQLEMIREKTRGNLSEEESGVLQNVLADLQLAFVQARTDPETPPTSPATDQTPEKESPRVAEGKADEEEAGSKKKFTKSYGS